MTILTLSSPEFHDGQMLDIRYQADQENQSPALNWSNIPEQTKSFAIAMHDPDAPTGGAGWWHWLAFNIPANTQSLPKNAGSPDGKNMPDGVQQMRNDGGTLGYMGCYPPEGDPPHRYIFTIYALNTAHLDIPEQATTSFAGFMINQHTIAKVHLTAYYQR